jgi:hypothetical protein
VNEGFLDVAYRRLKPGIEEWFRLMEWILVISALAFAATVTGHPLLGSLTYLSFAAFGVHTLFIHSPRTILTIFPSTIKGRPTLAEVRSNRRISLGSWLHDVRRAATRRDCERTREWTCHNHWWVTMHMAPST